jgi:hypothetical protein
MITDLAALSVPPLARSRAQQLPVQFPVNLPADSAPVLLTSLPPISIFDKPFSSMTESELTATFLNQMSFLFYHLSTDHLHLALLSTIVIGIATV